MSTFFTVAECCKSATADSLGIKNSPNAQETKNLEETIAAVTLIRIGWGAHVKANNAGLQGINVNSGFRNSQLNDAVGGSKTSAHLAGYALDLYPSNGKINEFEAFVRQFATDHAKEGFKWDQIIIEKNSAGKRWVHFGLKNLSGEQRMSLFNTTVK